MQDNMTNLKELARMAGIPTEPVSIVDVPNISTPQADLADEIAEAISDTLDMDWQPSWAAPNIIAIINRERRRARVEGAKAMQAVEPALYQLRHHQQQADMDGTFVTVSRQALDEVLDAIAALDPAQIAAQEPKP